MHKFSSKIQPTYIAMVVGGIISFGLLAIIGVGGFEFARAGTMLLVVSVLLVLFLNPRTGILFALIVRPGIDRIGSEAIGEIGRLSISSNDLLAIGVIAWGMKEFFTNWSHIRSILFKKQSIIFAIFLAVSLFSSIFISFSRADSLAELVRVVSIAAIFIGAGAYVNTLRKYKTLLYAILASLIVPTIVALSQFVQKFQYVSDDGIDSRVFGTLAHTNSLGFLEVVAIISLIVLITNSRDFISRLGYASALGVYGFILLITQTRGAWLGGLVALGAMGALKYRKLVVVVALGSIGLFTFVDFIRSRVMDIINLDPLGSIAWRIGFWQDMIPLVWAQPIFGHGFGLFQIVAGRVRDFRLGALEAHNDYLRLAIEGGLPLVIIYILLLLSVTFALWRLYRSSISQQAKVYYLGGFALAFAILVMSVGDNILRGTALQWSVWAIFGALLMGVGSQKKINK